MQPNFNKIEPIIPIMLPMINVNFVPKYAVMNFITDDVMKELMYMTSGTVAMYLASNSRVICRYNGI